MYCNYFTTFLFIILHKNCVLSRKSICIKAVFNNCDIIDEIILMSLASRTTWKGWRCWRRNRRCWTRLW